MCIRDRYTTCTVFFFIGSIPKLLLFSIPKLGWDSLSERVKAFCSRSSCLAAAIAAVAKLQLQQTATAAAAAAPTIDCYVFTDAVLNTNCNSKLHIYNSVGSSVLRCHDNAPAAAAAYDDWRTWLQYGVLG